MAKEFDNKLLDKLVAVLKKDGFGLSETHYVNATGIERSQIARYLYPAELKADPKLKVPQTGKAIAAARNKGLRWPRIAVYSGLSESKVKEMYTAETGQDPSQSYTGRGRKFSGPGTGGGGATSGRRSGTKTGSAAKKTAATSGRRGKAASAGAKAGTAASKQKGRRGTRASATAADPS